MAKTTASAAILEQLAAQHRRVLSDWRALLLLRRASFSIPPAERRWSQLPHDPTDLHPLLRQMRQRREIQPIRGLRHLYEVTVPYARTGIVDEEEVLMEASPYAALSHSSALVLHGLTNDLPKGLTATVARDGTGDLLPLDTEPRDWEGLPLVRGRTPPLILGRPVDWVRVKPERFFATAVYQPHGYSVRAMTPERTLVDGLHSPELCGGIASVLRAWVLARDTLDVNALVHQVDRLGIAVVRQRVGFVLDELGLAHPLVEKWRAQARRGGSSRLLGSAPYAPVFSERWNLSLNAPVAVLREGAA